MDRIWWVYFAVTKMQLIVAGSGGVVDHTYCVIDRGSLLQSIPWTVGKTYAEISQTEIVKIQE